ncbi:unnamed protein product [Rotaria socialis]|uniref:Uncharacterized protein n=1 Tax=Rotaria socialis TaxID=392032 RepID=A0A817TUR7_9BILA|nr:unnamed protein product [Rotaria socialis]CAF3324360.1 unnamed protein product [Rotaria socialis]CAF4366958.1 unnamed protein product [Rotaria socialis]CAF4680585.1 unnamed protein product [Rotaria socialis]
MVVQFEQKKLENEVVDMLLSDQHIILAVNYLPLPQPANKKESTNSVVATRIVIKFEMKTMQSIRLRT